MARLGLGGLRGQLLDNLLNDLGFGVDEDSPGLADRLIYVQGRLEVSPLRIRQFGEIAPQQSANLIASLSNMHEYLRHFV